MKLNREIIRLSVPAVISNITVPLLALSDTAITGHLGDISFLAAIAVGSMMFNSAFWLFGFLRMGTTGLTAQAFGASDSASIRRVFSQAFAIAIFAGLLIIILRKPLCSILLSIMDCDNSTSDLATEYFNITILSSPALLSTMAVNGWFFGMQTTLLPMIVSISTNIINIGLSLLLVFGLDIGFNGVAWGTFGANWIGLAIALALAIRFKGIRSLVTTPENIFRFSTLKRFFKVNGDIFLRSACIMAVSIAVTVFGSRINNLTLATNAVMMQFFIMFSYFMDGLAFTAEALTGRFAGNGDRTMLYRTIRHILAWGAGVMIVFFITYLLFSDVFVSMITDDSLVIQNIRHYSFFLVLIPPVTVAAFIFDGIYIGLTATGKMLGATFIASLAFFAVCTLHFNTPYFGFPDNYTIWTAFLIYLFLRGCILSLMTGKTINNFFHR